MSVGGAALTRSKGPSGSQLQRHRDGAQPATSAPAGRRTPASSPDGEQLRRARISSVVGRFGRSWALWNERTKPRPVVAAAGVGEVGMDGGEHVGGGRFRARSGSRLWCGLARAFGRVRARVPRRVDLRS
jgi:hypothetical protein